MNHELEPDPGFIRFAAESLLAQLHALGKESEGVKAGADLEFVHRMRVASRRLRARLAIFAELLPPRKASAWSKEVRRLTRALGAARDLDVQLNFVQNFFEGVAEPRFQPGLKRLLFRLRQRREVLQKKVTRAVNRMETGGLFADMEKTLRQLRMTAHLPEAEKPSPAAFQLAAAAMSEGFAEMESWEPYVHSPERGAELHAMRIAAKHFRYAMETFAEWYPDELKEPLKAVRRVQELLGDLHDGDVWIVFLPRFLEEERELALEYSGSSRTATRLRPGVLELARDRQEHRDQCYQEFAAHWEKCALKKVWPNLFQVLFAAIGPAGEEKVLVDRVAESAS